MATGASSAAPSSGNITVAFIMVAFDDQEFQDEYDQDYFEETAFASTNSMWDYFDEVSKGALNIEGEVFGPYTLDGDAADYSSGSSFVRDSVEIADDDIYYPDFDAVMAIHSGPGGESSGNSNDIWSAHWPSITINTDDEDEDGNDHVIDRISQVPEYQLVNGESNPLGVWCHEFGHELGLPDYYDTDGSSEGVGNWAVMAAGSWGNNGETPVYFSAYSRYWLGWDEPITIEDDITNLVIEPVSEGGNIYKLPIPGNWSESGEYFLLENRQKTKYDSYLPGEGLLIWHIDEEIMFSKWSSNTVNNDEEHKGMDLEEADGNDDLDSGTNRGDNGDPYRSGNFSKDTYPNSLAYNGSESGWKIENIEVSGLNIIVDISFLSKPIAKADADKAVIEEGESLQFYGENSSDEDGTIVNYTWEFGDGEFSYIENPIHTFTVNGSYNVKLTVCDNNDLCDSFILNIFVNKPPIAVVQISNFTILLGDTILFNASGSYDIDGEIEFYKWNFDDGYESNQALVEHEYQKSGTYDVTLLLTDDKSDITKVHYNIVVVNRLPIVNFDFTPINGDTLVVFNFIDQSYDNDGTVEEWLWDFGDGNTSTLQNPSHNFSLPGTYYVNLTVIDDQNGANHTIISLLVDNTPPIPKIHIEDGIETGKRIWALPSDKPISLDARVSFDNENDDLQFLWNINGEEFTGDTQDYTFPAGENEIILKVIDSRGDESTKTFTINAESIPILSLEYSSLNLVVDQSFTLISETNWGSLNLYKWKVNDENGTLIIEETSQNNVFDVSFSEAGSYQLLVTGRDVETNLWTKNYPLDITVYNNPVADFTFDEDSNEGQWMTFDGGNSSGLGLKFNWSLDGISVAGESEIIDIMIDSGGIHTVGLTVNQDPVGIAYIEKQFYTNHKPTGILSTNPPDPRFGEDFEVYMAAYDAETEANIEYLKITVYNTKGDKAWENSYDNQGANFNLVFEMQYTGTIVLDYKLIDEDGNIQVNSTSVDVLGWADVFVESLEVNGKKEKGKKQDISIVLTNYNEIYLSKWYNGHPAQGKLNLIANDEIIHSWDYNIDGDESQEFNFEWIALDGYYLFEVTASISDGEVITDNNYGNITVIIEGERKSGFLNSPSILLSMGVLILVSTAIRRKAN